jgi:hypothetical protein
MPKSLTQKVVAHGLISSSQSRRAPAQDRYAGGDQRRQVRASGQRGAIMAV